MDLEEIRQDFAAFADSEEDVIIDRGVVLFRRNRQDLECRITESGGIVEVEFNGTRIPYPRFLSHELGHLPILAEAIRQKRKDVSPYIDTRAVVIDHLGKSSAPGSAFELLRRECQDKPVGETKLLFLTAAAGEGKTALLRRLTQDIAARYIAHKASLLLLHVDTQGRSFVRLEEAVARDLGQLRISGLFYSGIVRLIKNNLLAIAIDGFDELLAEIGSSEAYSGLGGFLHQLDGTGVVVAAARSAYFEAENYAAQSKLLTSLPNSQVGVSQMTLQKWNRPETVEYFGAFRGEEDRKINNPSELYDELAERLGSTHPVLQRPFLVHQMAAILTSSATAAGELAREVGPAGIRVVPNLIQAFLKREVDLKWRDPAGQPYLTLEEHVQLLAAIADEMWTQGKNSLPVDIVQLVTDTVIEGMHLPLGRRVQVLERIKAHALLPPNSLAPSERTFDHEEFLNYFLAIRLINLLRHKDAFGLERFCERHTLPAIVSAWTANIIDWTDEQIGQLILRLSESTRSEVRSTYLKQNAGSLAAQLARRGTASRSATFSFDSMFFEGDEWREAKLENAEFRKCTFVNIDLSGTLLRNCVFRECQFDGLSYDGSTRLDGSRFDPGCLVLGVIRLEGGQHATLRNYVPDDCNRTLQDLGASFEEPPKQLQLAPPVPADRREALATFFRIFSRNSGATDTVIQLKLGTRLPLFKKVILPLLLKHALVRPTEYRGRGDQKRYELNFPLEVILRAEDPHASVPPSLKKFWEELRS